MAAVDELNIDAGAITADTKALFAAAFWMWYQSHLDFTIPVRIWIIRTSVSIRQLQPLFVLLFGEQPVTING